MRSSRRAGASVSARRALRELGQRIRDHRERAGLSQTELGEPYATRSTVSLIESGRAAPSFPLLIHFAHRLKTTVRQLVPPKL